MEPISFDIDIVSRDDATIVVVDGEIDLAATRDLDAWLRRAEGLGRGPVVVDLSRVSFIDAGGLDVIARHAAANAEQVLIADPSPPVRKLIEMTGLDERLPLAEGPGEAFPR